MNTTSHAWYALRRTLPPFRFDELLAEMVEQLPRYRVDEVLVLVDDEDLFHGHATPEMAAEAARNLVRLRDALAQAGVAYSLNPWITRGHEDRCRGALPGMQTTVHADGSTSAHIGCPLCPTWRDNLAATWAIYAATKPRVLWIDDDIRDWGAHECFCPLHMERFSQRVGRPVTREEMVAAVFQPGEPHPWRALMLELRNAVTQEVLRLIVDAARRANPDVTMGLMSSGPRNHCREGRDWKQCADSLGGTVETPIYSRPTMGNYWEWGPPRGLYFSQDSIKITRHALPAGTVDQTELESLPFSRYSKSVAFTFAQLAVSFAFGARGTTINVFDHLGTPMQAEPHYGKMLGARKDFLNAVAERTRQPGVFRGVQLLFREDTGRKMHLLPKAGSEGLAAEGYQGMEAFEAAGIPTTYDESEVLFLCGQQPRLLTDDEIKALLAKGLFVDGPAAALLCERGFAADLGLSAATAAIPLNQSGILAAELCDHPEFGGGPGELTSALLPMSNYGASLSSLSPLKGARIVSQLVDPDIRPVRPCMTAFENSRGGRVVVHAWDYATAIGPVGVSFHSPVRQRQLQAVVGWLFRGAAPLLVSGDGAWPLVLRKDLDGESLVGLLNLSLDAWPGAMFEMAANGPAAHASLPDPEGNWLALPVGCCKIQEGVCRIKVSRPITLESPLFVRVVWDK